MTQSATFELTCPLWRRLLALFYDVFAVLAIVMVVGLLCQLATRGTLITRAGHVHIAWWYQPLQGLVIAAYFLMSWLRGGQTLGMRPWRIRVTRLDGKGLSLRQALLRLIAAGAPLFLLLLAPVLGVQVAAWSLLAAWIIWFGVAAFDPRRRAVHDWVAGSELRKAG